MRTTIVTPPSLVVPGVPHWSLPVAIARLRAAGRTVTAVDLERRAADLLLTRERIDRVLALGRATLTEREARRDQRAANDLKKALDRIAPALAFAEDAKATLRDATRFRDPRAFRAAFDTVTADLAFLHQLDPVIAPARADFAAAVRAHLDGGAWSPLRDLHDDGLLDPIQDECARGAEEVVLWIARDSQACEAVRIARSLAHRLPSVRVVAAGPLVDRHRDAWRAAGLAVDPRDTANAIHPDAGADFSTLDARSPFTPAPILPLHARRLADARALASVGAQFVQVQTDGASLDAAALRRIARARSEARASFLWVAPASIDRALADSVVARELFDGGCRSLVLEFGTARDSAVATPPILATLRGAGISAELAWTLGARGESHADVRATLDFLSRHRTEFGFASFESPARADGPITPDELALLARGAEATSDRAIVERALHLPHVAAVVDLPAIARPFTVSADVLAYLDASDGFRGGRRASAFAAGDFGFRARVADAFPTIRAEWDALAKERLRPWPQDEAYDGAWTLFALWMSGKRFDENCALCPETTRVVESIPGMVAAGFSILGARSTLPIHCGLRKDVLRFHLAIDIPDDSALLLHGEARAWTEGGTFVFDDTLPHAAWNRSDRDKVILVVDFLRTSTDAERVAGAAMDGEFFGALFPEWKVKGR